VKSNPLAVRNPEFRCADVDGTMAIEVGLEISHPSSGSKSSRLNNLFISTSSGGYPMKLAVRLNTLEDKWHTIDEEISSISIQIPGDYEAMGLVGCLQHIGLMSLPIYGRMNNSEEE